MSGAFITHHCRRRRARARAAVLHKAEGARDERGGCVQRLRALGAVRENCGNRLCSVVRRCDDLNQPVDIPTRHCTGGQRCR